MANSSNKVSKDTYKEMDGYKVFMSNRGLLSESQHKKLLKGESVDLKDAPDKQLQYLLVNNLIKKV